MADRNDDRTPIRWRILSRNEDDAYVMSDQVLDCKPYHETNKSVTWETSTLRQWLNDADGIRSVKLNGKAIKIKAGKKKLSFKLSKYKKWLKKPGKWNRLVITDRKGEKKTVKFKIK